MTEEQKEKAAEHKAEVAHEKEVAREKADKSFDQKAEGLRNIENTTGKKFLTDREDAKGVPNGTSVEFITPMIARLNIVEDGVKYSVNVSKSNWEDEASIVGKAFGVKFEAPK